MSSDRPLSCSLKVGVRSPWTWNSRCSGPEELTPRRSGPSVCRKEDVCDSLGCVVLGMTAVLGCEGGGMDFSRDVGGREWAVSTPRGLALVSSRSST